MGADYDVTGFHGLPRGNRIVLSKPPRAMNFLGDLSQELLSDVAQKRNKSRQVDGIRCSSRWKGSCLRALGVRAWPGPPTSRVLPLGALGTTSRGTGQAGLSSRCGAGVVVPRLSPSQVRPGKVSQGPQRPTRTPSDPACCPGATRVPGRRGGGRRFQAGQGVGAGAAAQTGPLAGLCVRASGAYTPPR